MGMLKFVHARPTQNINGKDVERGDGVYVAFDADIPVYIISKFNKVRWSARDMDGNPINKPDQYRNDLFERLDIEYRASKQLDSDLTP